MNALHERVVHVRVAFAAGRRNIEFVDRRLGVIRRQNLVRPMTICAHSGFLRTHLRRPTVNALLVADERLRAFPARLHQEFLPVAPPARVWNVLVIHRRLRISARHHLMRAAMAILAPRSRHALLARNRMGAMRVSLLRVRMALPAGNLFGRRIVRQALHVGVAIHARKQPSVDGVLLLRLIHKQADRLPVHVSRQRLVAVAGKAIRILELGLSFGFTGPEDKKQSERIS